MKKRKVISSFLLLGFCLAAIYSMRKRVEKVSNEEALVRKLEMATENLDHFLIKSCTTTINLNHITEGEVPTILAPTPETDFIIANFSLKLFKAIVSSSTYQLGLIQMKSTNPVFLKYDVSALSIYLYLKKDQSGKFINCYGKSFQQ